MIKLSNKYVTLSVGELRKAIKYIPDNEPIIIELLEINKKNNYVYSVKEIKYRKHDDGIIFKGFYIFGYQGFGW